MPLPVALELVRAMLRDNGLWCGLEVEDGFTVHVGWDQYLYVGSDLACEAAVARTRALGLFAERVDASPYAQADDEPAGEQRPADEIFWDHLRWWVTTRGAALLEETPVDNVTRWHRLDEGPFDPVRARLAPRAKLALWPDLVTDVAAVLAALPADEPVEVVWEDRDGRISSTTTFDESRLAAVRAHLATARAAALLSVYLDDRTPLCTAVLPDADGVLRARWRTEPTRSDRDWAFLKALRPGEVRPAVISEVTPSGAAVVDLGGFAASAETQELGELPGVLAIGRRVEVTILEVDLVRERVSFSLGAGSPRGER
ncbi:S1 RNA-binding domain-containing protein [Kitasatospora sp. LaBMicrA B282]|uniref:S1 RNA-binding domain-containing protein n=1 Tax=Kitasatospora sp. LaBMicrA B282 TaxID=3420949 RepID=UPI003D0BDFFD